jgi:UDP-N-acetylmuramoyl-tripeptide--D-alanyl-D-alanine ligase
MVAQFSAPDLQHATHGTWCGNPVRLSALTHTYPVVTDSRQVAPGCVFLALVGDLFDGHTYVKAAIEAGAVAAIVTAQWWDSVSLEDQSVFPAPVLVVDHTLWAYMALGAFHRQRCQAKVIALTGSSGKTTVKETLFRLLTQLAPTQATQKNYNNDIGLTQTLLAIEPTTQFQICEMGMRGPGEIERLSRAARPDVALLLNIGPAHLGRLGSLEAIAQAKCEIVTGLDPVTGQLIANGDDPLLQATVPTVWPLPGHKTDTPPGTVWVSETTNASEIGLTPQGRYQFVWQGHTLICPQPGRHAVMNSLLVLQTALTLGFEPAAIAVAFSRIPGETDGRWQQHPLMGDGLANSCVVNDAYNANPASMAASLAALAQTLAATTPAQQAVLVLGGMNELGAFSHQYHTELGVTLATLFADSATLAGLVLVGGQEADWVQQGMQAAEADAPPPTMACPVVRCPDAPTVTQALQAHGLFPRGNTVYFLKASRSYQLETVAAALLSVAQPNNKVASL